MKKCLKQFIVAILIAIFVFSPVLANAKVANKRPSRVTGVSAKLIGKTTIKITFKKVKGAKGYKIYRSTYKNKKFKLIKTTKLAVFKNKNLKSGKKYFYKVKAYKINGKKTYLSKKFSKTVSAKTPDKKPIIETPPEIEEKPSEPECLLGDSCLNTNGEGADNMIWSWWYYPQVVSHQNKLFFCFTTNDSYCGIAQCDQNTKQITKTTLKKATTQDDHNSLALTLLENNKILCAYAGGHNTDNLIHIRISKNPLDITEFEHSIVLRSSGKTCYSQIIKSNGRYYLFYRVNNSSWAYRFSENGYVWSEETIFVKAGMQYYCKVMPTTDENLLRIIMYSNPSQTATEIRMGFLNTNENSFYNSDGITKVANEKNTYTDFNVILDKPTGKNQTQRLFDVAITDPQSPEFLYTVFSKTKGSDDSIYYLYDSGKIHEICHGGKALMDPKYQLGASFIDKNNIVVGRNEVGTDYIETYYYNGESVSFSKTIDAQIGCANSRNARPIVDINGKAFLWHNGYYNKNNYTDFSTSARIYFIDSGEKIGGNNTDDLTNFSSIKPENKIKAEDYIRKIAEDSKLDDYLQMGLKWEQVERKTNWIYYTGLVFEGLLEYDFDEYKWQIKDFYNQYINENGTIKKYAVGELDSAMLGAPLLKIITSDIVTDEEKARFCKGLNYIYNQLENQTIYEQAGNLWLHSQLPDGSPRTAWTKWNICLDGVYMSQLFLTRLATEIDNGNVAITDKNGELVKSEKLWQDIYTRLNFVMKNMIDKETGLLNHGYCVKTGETNNARWSRGIGWFAMALLDATEKMPDKDKREVLTKHFNSLMSAICRWQDDKTNLWYNVTDGKEEYFHTTKDGEIIYNMPETSASGMFAFCLLKGYHIGLLDSDEFYKAGLRAFNSLVELKLKDEGLIDTYASSSVTTDKNRYQVNGYVTNDGKGVGPFILTAKWVF